MMGVMAVLSPIVAYSQGWQVITVEGGYEYGMRLRLEEITNARNYLERTDVPVHHDYNSTALMGVGISLPRTLGRDIGLEARAMVGYSVLAMRREEVRYPIISSGTGTERIIDYDVSARVITLGLDLVARNNLFGELYVEYGMWGNYRASSSFKRYIEIISPAGAKFDMDYLPDSNIMVLEEGTNFAAYDVTVGPMISLGYTIPISSDLALRPAVRMRADINSIINYNRPFWRDFSLGGGIGVMLGSDSYPDSLADFPPVDPSDADEPPGRPLRASIDLYCQSDAGERLQSLPVRRSITMHRGYLPFIPFFQWDSGSERIPDRYVLLSAAGQFTSDSPALADPLQLHHNGLNVLGMRLRTVSGSVVRLVGGTASGEPARLGRRRAERLRQYLHEVWGVNPSRVAVESENGTGAHVEIAGAAREITRPILVEWKSEDLDAPQIGVSPSMEGGAGLKSWELVIRHGRRDVARQSSDGGSQNALDMGLILRDLGTNADRAELVAELTVIDSAGERAVALDRLPILMDTSASGNGDRARTFFVLLPPADGMPEAVSPSMDSIVAMVREGDRIGVHYRNLPTANAGAALRHAEQVIQRLRTSLRQHRLGHLNPELIADDTYERSSSPEAAMFDAAVTVVVEGGGRKSESNKEEVATGR